MSSFTQDQRHATKSTRFQPVKPEMVAEVLSNHGFKLAFLKSGRAILADRIDHQTTIARYRSETKMKIDGHYLDIVAKVPHLYGAVELFLGTYRLVCQNGLSVGTKFASFKIKHLGNPVDEINQILPVLVAQETKLIKTIQSMQAVELAWSNQLQLASQVAKLRLTGINNVVQVNSQDLLSVQRDADNSSDLYTVMNRIQENIVKSGLKYTYLSTDAKGITSVRNGTARRLGDSSIKSIEVNRSIWDLSTNFLKVG